MSDLDDYIRELAKWRGETISSIKELNKNDDDLNANMVLLMKRLSDIEHRLTILETKSKMVGAILIPIVVSIAVILFEILIRGLL